MPRPLKIFLVRHAVSAANLDKSVNARLPDSEVPLAPEGHDQAIAAGEALREYLLEHCCNERTRILCSPYLRTRQTADGIIKGLGKGIEFDFREDIALREISFGLFDGLSDDEIPIHFPKEQAYYQKHVDFEGEFYAPMPLGESRVQVADRVKTIFGTILRDAVGDRDDRIANFIIVSHGVTLRAFMMQWMHHNARWYQEQPNPNNASISLITGSHVRYIAQPLFGGFPYARKTVQDVREEGSVKPT